MHHGARLVVGIAAEAATTTTNEVIKERIAAIRRNRIIIVKFLKNQNTTKYIKRDLENEFRTSILFATLLNDLMYKSQRGADHGGVRKRRRRRRKKNIKINKNLDDRIVPSKWHLIFSANEKLIT